MSGCPVDPLSDEQSPLSVVCAGLRFAGVALGIHDEDLDVLAGGKDVVRPAVAENSENRTSHQCRTR